MSGLLIWNSWELKLSEVEYLMSGNKIDIYLFIYSCLSLMIHLFIVHCVVCLGLEQVDPAGDPTGLLLQAVYD